VNAAQLLTEMENFKGNFLNIFIFLHPQIPDFQIVVVQLKYESQF